MGKELPAGPQRHQQRGLPRSTRYGRRGKRIPPLTRPRRRGMPGPFRRLTASSPPRSSAPRTTFDRSVNSTKIRLLAASSGMTPAAVAKTPNVAVPPAPIGSVTLAAGAPLQFPPASVSQSERVRGSTAPPVVADTAMVAPIPTFDEATAKALCLRLQRGGGVRGWERDGLGTGARARGARVRRAFVLTTR